MADSERRPGRPVTVKGWSEVRAGNEAVLKSAARKVGRVVNLAPDQFEHVSFSTGDEIYPGTGLEARYKSVRVEPTQQELETAPRAIKRVLRDLGIKPDDKVTIGLCAGFQGFDFTVRPAEVTEDRVGMTLSTNPTRAAVIAPIRSRSSWPREDGTVVTDPMIHGINDNNYYLFKGNKVEMLIDTYGHIFDEVNNPKTWNHEMVNMLSEAANWGSALVASRRKPQSA